MAITISGDNPNFQNLSSNTTISVGGATPSASGAGITFPATQSASTDANTLDDYEEGTWTPTDVSGAGLSFTTAVGFYTKIGRQVIASFRVDYPSTANTALAQIGGLPFAVSSASDGANGGTFIRYTTYGSSFTLPANNNATNLVAYNFSGAGLGNNTFSLKRVDAVVVYNV